MDHDFWASLNKVVAGAGAYITDPQGRPLLVKPNYRDHWSFAGGHIDEGEHPAQACAREVAEELGLSLPVGRLLTVQWGQLPEQPFPLIHFLFDCGIVEVDAPVRLQAEELDDYGFFTEEESKGLLPPHLYDRLRAAGTARRDGASLYLPPAG
ncbi:NUDIX hydrolase [Nonomuraea sp. NPDC046570]|uniref:NUDIX hydrolase n=1 Tax=Nonomuraea sp. NPDC046570 TaxID=3155255 RepID=UPI0033FBA87D